MAADAPLAALLPKQGKSIATGVPRAREWKALARAPLPDGGTCAKAGRSGRGWVTNGCDKHTQCDRVVRLLGKVPVMSRDARP